jgi:hypothetical protein
MFAASTSGRVAPYNKSLEIKALGAWIGFAVKAGIVRLIERPRLADKDIASRLADRIKLN